MSNAESVWNIPEPLSKVDVRVDEDTVITLRRHGNPEGRRLVLTHGNGLSIDLYYPFWSLLADDFDLIVYDLRNHGWNPVSTLENHNIPTLVNDHDLIMEAIDRNYGQKPKIGVFHSVSGLISLLSPTKGSGFEARILFDPPLCKPGRSYYDFEEATALLVAMTRRRKHLFKTRESFAQVLGFLPNFKRLDPGLYDLFAKTTLRESTVERGYELCCPPEYEAQMIDYAGIYAVLIDFDTMKCPTKVIGADPTLQYSYLPTLDLSDILTVDYDFLPDATHFLQLEEPEQCVDALREFIELNDSL
ncbi:MAG: alpha/beta hydrolase [Chloroflexi bacterium]|nr:alpha/beta hydrolase [Chloroflexota bacterium]